MAEQLKTVVDRLLSGLLGDAEHADKARPQIMVDMLSDWLPYRVYDPATPLCRCACAGCGPGLPWGSGSRSGLPMSA